MSLYLLIILSVIFFLFLNSNCTTEFALELKLGVFKEGFYFQGFIFYVYPKVRQPSLLSVK